MIEIKTINGYLALIDDEDFEGLNEYEWTGVQIHRSWYARRYEQVDGKQRPIFMHREIMKAGKGTCVDHRNKDGMDNQKENLRFGTVAQSQYGRRLNKNSSTGYKGVFWNTRKSKYYAQIYKSGRRTSLGAYHNPIDAAKAYNQAALLYFGEYARLNEIPKDKP
jgi:hypothetical protein